MRPYKSPFDKLSKKRGRKIFETYSEYFKFLASTQQFHGTLREVLARLEQPERGQEIETIIMQAPRIIRAVIDYKIEKAGAPLIEELVEDAIQLTMHSFQRGSADLQEIEQFQERIKDSGNSYLLDFEIEQELDSTTWNATDPNLSEKTVKRITKQEGSRDILLLGIAHGGIPSGIDVFLRYRQRTYSEGSKFYVARFSGRKKHDLTLRLTEREKEKISKSASTRRVIIFDEDCCTGHTLRIAQKEISEITGLNPNQVTWEYNYMSA